MQDIDNVRVSWRRVSTSCLWIWSMLSLFYLLEKFALGLWDDKYLILHSIDTPYLQYVFIVGLVAPGINIIIHRQQKNTWNYRVAFAAMCATCAIFIFISSSLIHEYFKVQQIENQDLFKQFKKNNQSSDYFGYMWESEKGVEDGGSWYTKEILGDTNITYFTALLNNGKEPPCLMIRVGDWYANPQYDYTEIIFNPEETLQYINGGIPDEVFEQILSKYLEKGRKR